MGLRSFPFKDTLAKYDIIALFKMSYDVFELNVCALANFTCNVQITQEILHVTVQWGRSDVLMAFRAFVISRSEDRCEAVLVENSLTLITRHGLVKSSDLVAKRTLEALS